GETYTVSLEELIFYINQLIDENIDRIYQGSKQYIIEQFEKDTKTFFQNIQQYLGEYQDLMNLSLTTQQQSEEKQELMVKQLKSLENSSKEQINNVTNNIEPYIDSLLSLNL
ncbi:hypothetical protein, partial [Moorena sp. SIO4G3]|uniref:hypothetical protein n=1 Tax=Moorena sp. SIO4G3 TaxID=2607821 RepID=UPI00142ABFF1